MKIAPLLAVAAVSVQAKVDWLGICTGTEDVATNCGDLERSATFACLAAKVSDGSNMLVQECTDAILERNREARQADARLWQTSCAEDVAAFCQVEAATALAVEQEQLQCLSTNQVDISEECHAALVILQQMINKQQQQQQQRAAQQQAQAQQARPQPPPAARPSGFQARIRSAAQPELCWGFPVVEAVGAAVPCDGTDGSQAFSVIQTARGYVLAIGRETYCLNFEGLLVPCNGQSLTYFSLDRRADHTVTIKDLFSGNCLGAGMDFQDACDADGAEPSPALGWFVEPRFTKFVVNDSPPADAAPAPAAVPAPAAPAAPAAPVAARGPESAQEPEVFLVKPAAPKGKGKFKGKFKGKGKVGKGKFKGKAKPQN